MALLRSSRTSNRSVPRRALRFRTESTWDSPPDVRTVVSLILRADLPDRRTTCAPTGGMDGDAGAAEEGEEAKACPSPRPPAGPPPRAIVRTPALADRTLRLRLGDGGGVAASPSAGSAAAAAAAGRAVSRTSSSSLLARSWASRAAPWESLLDAAATSLVPMSSSPLTPSGSTCCSCAARTASITPLSDLARSARSAGSHTWYSMPRSHRSSPSSAAAAASPHPHVRPDDAPPPPPPGPELLDLPEPVPLHQGHLHVGVVHVRGEALVVGTLDHGVLDSGTERHSLPGPDYVQGAEAAEARRPGQVGIGMRGEVAGEAAQPLVPARLGRLVRASGGGRGSPPQGPVQRRVPAVAREAVPEAGGTVLQEAGGGIGPPIHVAQVGRHGQGGRAAGGGGVGVGVGVAASVGGAGTGLPQLPPPPPPPPPPPRPPRRQRRQR